jgi:hypothetical protein
MIKRLFAIALIFGGASVAWMILGGSIFTRTYDSDNHLKQGVTGSWGGAQAQVAPHATYTENRKERFETEEKGKLVVKFVDRETDYAIPVDASQIKTAFDLAHRQKGLLWYATYKVDFAAQYRFVNTSGKPRDVTIYFPFPDKQAVYDDFVFRVRGKEWKAVPNSGNGIASAVVTMAQGETLWVEVGYRSQGLDSWRYQFGTGVGEVKNFQLTMNTNFRDIDYPAEALAPSNKVQTTIGWRLVWDYKRLVSGADIGMVMPQRLQPGPLAAQIAFFAPVSLLFFMVVMLVIGVMKKIDIHPMHFAFLAAAFFAFHLLLAYLADQVSFTWAFAIAAGISVFLVVSYLRLVFGNRFAFGYAGVAQLVYLVLFSYAFFFKGLTGLTITIGAILTLFVLMQVTARVNWGDVFKQQRS